MIASYRIENKDTGSLNVGSVEVRPGDRIHIVGEASARTVTFVMGRVERSNLHAVCRGTGVMPLGPVEFTVSRMGDRSADPRPDGSPSSRSVPAAPPGASRARGDHPPPLGERWITGSGGDTDRELTISAGGEFFLGIDVGYSEKRESLGFCVVRLQEIAAGRFRIGVARGAYATVGHTTTSYLERFLEHHLPRLLKVGASPANRLIGIGIDGPLTHHASPLLTGSLASSYRPCEHVLSAVIIPQPIKAQGFLGGGAGHHLYSAAMAIRDVANSAGYRLDQPGQSSPQAFVVESFPKLWLGLLRNPDDCSTEFFTHRGIKRSERDWQMARECFPLDERVTSHATCALAGLGVEIDRAILPTVMANKDVAAAYVSGLTAALHRLGRSAHLGSGASPEPRPNHSLGGFTLPCSSTWHPGWRERLQSAMASESDLGLGRSSFVEARK